jgi:hypothetical protein
MRRTLLGLAVLLLVAACDKPDQVYRKLPPGFDPVTGNGLGPVAAHYTGTKGFVDETAVTPPIVPTREVCADAEVAAKNAAMVNEPIVPMKGAGGLDMTGGAAWAGLTIDDAQSPDLLCQASYYGDGVAAWGDNYEVIAFFSPTTRLIDDILVTPGYLGTLTAGDFVLEINEPIRKAGTPLSQTDGSAGDARSEDNLRQMDRALIRAFRPSLDADQVDCIESGSCYIIMSGTLPVLVFMSVNVYVVLEPQELRIVQLEVALKRPFRIGAGEIDVTGPSPVLHGTAAAGIPDCQVTYGTTWKHIREKCLGDDPMAMASVTAVNGYENVLVDLGGVLLYLDRPGLAVDQILPIAPVPEDGDTVGIISVNAAYEGSFAMPYSDVLRLYKGLLDRALREDVPDLPEDAMTGIDLLRTPDDPALPDSVKHAYPDRLRPGGIFAVFCMPDLGDDGKYTDCLTDSSGRPTLPLTGALQYMVSAVLGDQAPARFQNTSFFVQQLLMALATHFNGGPITTEQINLLADSDSPDRIYATTTLFVTESGQEVPYTVNAYYGGNDDRLHFLNFQKGSSRMERVLLQDAALPTPNDPEPSGVFTLTHLVDSPRLGLGAYGAISVDQPVPETRRALLTVTMDETTTTQVLAPYTAASSVSGYWVPLEGPQDRFTPADWISLSGNTIGAGLFLAPVGPGPADRVVVAVTATDFFGTVPFCGFDVRIGDYASQLLAAIADEGFPCTTIVRRSENREFVTSIADMDGQVRLTVNNDMIGQVTFWLQ